MKLISCILFAVNSYEMILEVSLLFPLYVNRFCLFMEYYLSNLAGDFLSSAGAHCINGSTRIEKGFHLVLLSLANVIAYFVLAVGLYITAENVTAVLQSCDKSISKLKEWGL